MVPLPLFRTECLATDRCSCRLARNMSRSVSLNSTLMLVDFLTSSQTLH